MDGVVTIGIPCPWYRIYRPTRGDDLLNYPEDQKNLNLNQYVVPIDTDSIEANTMAGTGCTSWTGLLPPTFLFYLLCTQRTNGSFGFSMLPHKPSVSIECSATRLIYV